MPACINDHLLCWVAVLCRNRGTEMHYVISVPVGHRLTCLTTVRSHPTIPRSKIIYLSTVLLLEFAGGGMRGGGPVLRSGRWGVSGNL